ncbi:NADPH-dependent FMN reductase [Melghirimyces algeriensis]|uniref:NAD(P)H-dependent FMN reductase n=1 Tax=Melghirimyces algeriensis TaxID=910412 RepID=A0A521EL95_9BACL|nr:NADPH-dependent FMN reductase [Melghirimyces algeriensis]SMO83910.1 NAD(P)H-dependent FMN reductase [Melghirimyces algeriensis]
MKIMVINGSPREKSLTGTLADRAEQKLVREGATVIRFDVGQAEVPLFRGGTEGEAEIVRQLKEDALSVDGFFICTPEYHNGISGALKNVLDFLNGSHFKGKPTAIAAAAGGGRSGINALNNLRLVLRGLYAWVLPSQIVVDSGSFDMKGEWSDPEIRERMDNLGADLVHAVRALGNR